MYYFRIKISTCISETELVMIQSRTMGAKMLSEGNLYYENLTWELLINLQTCYDVALAALLTHDKFKTFDSCELCEKLINI